MSDARSVMYAAQSAVAEHWHALVVAHGADIAKLFLNDGEDAEPIGIGHLALLLAAAELRDEACGFPHEQGSWERALSYHDVDFRNVVNQMKDILRRASN